MRRGEISVLIFETVVRRGKHILYLTIFGFTSAVIALVTDENDLPYRHAT
jgi:hypothetical protein